MWQKIFFNTQNIIGQTDRAVLIKMPNKSHYNGYSFWHSSKLVREQGGKGYHSSFAFTPDFTFRLKKYGAGRYNRMDVISEEEITVDQMCEAFGVVNEVVHDAVECETDKINEKIAKLEETETIVEVHIPERKEPVQNLEPNKNLLK